MEKHTIIIVEDDEITALNLKLSLQKHGYKILATCDNALDALLSIVKNKPHIVIIDISLQEGSDGIALGRKIRQTTLFLLSILLHTVMMTLSQRQLRRSLMGISSNLLTHLRFMQRFKWLSLSTIWR